MHITPATDHDRLLHAQAEQAKAASYSPYSRFRVGAAVRAGDRVYRGTNIENSSYPVTVCAEQSAVSAAITANERRIDAVAVAGDVGSLSPCGTCRQLLAEFGSPALRVTYLWGDELVTVELGDLMPHGFTLAPAEHRAMAPPD